MKIAFCYLTDGKNDPFMRRLSMASLRRFCGDVPIYTATAGGLYKSSFGEHILDLSKEWERVFGNTTKPGDKLPDPGNGYRAMPAILFCKLLIPVSPEMSAYDRVVFLDDDVEVQSSGMLDMPALRDDADLGMVPDTVMNMPGKKSVMARVPEEARRMWPDCTYHTAAVLLHRGTCTSGYIKRVKTCFSRCGRLQLWLPEEMAANLFMRVQSLPETYAVVPESLAVNRAGRPLDQVRASVAAHYGGPRKRAFLEDWASRYPDVKR